MDSIPFPEVLGLFQENPRALIRSVPGIFPVDKPEGISSFRAVAIARKRLDMRRIGHGGTLDPMATGLLLLLAGNAARLFDHLLVFPKTYVARMRLGVVTDSQDATGVVLETHPVPPMDNATLAAACEHFMGEILQVPPMYSALKRDGKPLYALAREGKTVERAPRPVSVYKLSAHMEDAEHATLTMTVSSGFYVRTLIHDLGARLGCGAMMAALRRTEIGPFSLADACAPEEITAERTLPLSS